MTDSPAELPSSPEAQQAAAAVKLMDHRRRAGPCGSVARADSGAEASDGNCKALQTHLSSIS
jgi:hypothetical protein